jgi:hypothetical protein
MPVQLSKAPVEGCKSVPVTANQDRLRPQPAALLKFQVDLLASRAAPEERSL